MLVFSNFFKFGKCQLFVFTMVLFFIIGCANQKKDEPESQPPGTEEIKEGILVSSILNALADDLLLPGISTSQVAQVRSSAKAVVIQQNLTQSTDIGPIVSAVLEGAILGVSDFELTRVKKTVISTAIHSMFDSVRRKSSEYVLENKSENILVSIFGSLTSISVRYLEVVGIPITQRVTCIYSFVHSITANFYQNGVTADIKGEVITRMATNAVRSLKKAGIKSDQRNNAINAVMSAILARLSSDRLDSQTIASFADEVVYGAVLGLKEAGVTDAELDAVIESVKEGVNRAMDDADVEPSDKAKVQEKISEAANNGKSQLT